jgi:hypothetical protein
VISTSETSVNIYETTRSNILEDCHLRVKLSLIFFVDILSTLLITLQKLNSKFASGEAFVNATLACLNTGMYDKDYKNTIQPFRHAGDANNYRCWTHHSTLHVSCNLLFAAKRSWLLLIAQEKFGK